MKGGKGGDALFGNPSDDFLDGGKGVDTCLDDKGANVVVDCESSEAP